ncbi:precursor of CEP9-like [Durio zibethinus]|uniref:Precursor of CEP9-like n=1 Tax=Durio zibethinus TaxID=66656 RepID=A0A6P5ZIU4_DURZI|nr:precursor of CEP9-like [Durio zibethinus]
MDKCAVFLLAVIACSHLVFSVEGRKIKPMTKLGSKQSNQVDNSAVHKEDHQPAAPSYIPNADAYHSASASGKKEVLSPPTPTKSSDFGDSLAGYNEDFLPAKAGSSPGGVGHSFAEDHEDTEQKSGSISPSNNKHSTAGAKEDSRPTSPGHSPGAGNSLAEDDENTEQKS